MELIRTVRLQPYRKGCGPMFTLRLFDTGEMRGSHFVIRAELRQHENGKATIIFAPDDTWFGIVGHAIDSDTAVAHVLGCLTLKPGDADAEYFAQYTPTQIEFCEQHAETLGIEAISRFGE